MRYRIALGEVIREERIAQQLFQREIARRGIISVGHLSDVERGQKEISSELLDGVACGLGVKAYELVIRAGLKMAGQEIPDTPAELLDTALQFGFDKELTNH
jgi:transcriptional regulator with XRE-family HTH domain